MVKVMIYSDYEKIAKVGDRIILDGKGIMSGINTASKTDSHKVVFVSPEKILLTAYRGKRRGFIKEGYKDQAVAIYTEKEFQKLPLYK